MFLLLKRDLLGHKSGDRLEVPDSEAVALLASGAAEKVGEVDSLAHIQGEIRSAVDDALKEFARTSTLSRKNALPRILGAAGGEVKRTFGRFLLAVRNHDRKALDEMGSQFVEWDDSATQKIAMSTQTGTNGGYLVPTEFHDRLMALVIERSVVRPRATIIPMTTRTCQIPAIDVTSVPSAGDTALLGGVVGRWTEEASTINETEPNLKQIELTNYELSGYSKVSNTLLNDSAIGLETFLMQLFSRAIAWYEDYAFLRGNGVGKPLGLLAWPGLISVTRTAANEFRLADVAKMYARLVPGGDARSITWVMHPTVLAQLIQMTGGDNVIFLGNDVTGKPRMKILNYDIAISEKVPALGTAGDVLLCDFQHYLLGDRQQIEIAYSEHVAFLTNQSVWRFVSRIAGQPWLRDKITLADGSNTLSPFISLS